MSDQTCPLCRGREVDPDMGREQVWEDAHWRLTTSIGPGDPTPGFSYLEPKRHIPSIADLDGGEAVTFGLAIARSTKAIKQATGSEAVYVYVYGGHIPHLHVHWVLIAIICGVCYLIFDALRSFGGGHDGQGQLPAH